MIFHAIQSYHNNFVLPINLKSKMKALLTVLLLSYSAIINAQHFYVNAGGGINTALLPQVIDVYTKNNTLINNKGSYGEGLNKNLGCGYLINKYIAFEIQYSHLISKHDLSNNLNLDENKIEATMHRIIPSVKLTTGNKFRPFISFGFIAGINPVITRDYADKMSPYGEYVEGHLKYSGGSSFGFSNTLGLEYKSSGRIAGFLQLNTIIQNWSPDKMDYVTIQHYRFVDYASSGTINFENEVLNFMQNGSSLRKYFPFNSIGLQTGITYYFQKKEKKSE